MALVDTSLIPNTAEALRTELRINRSRLDAIGTDLPGYYENDIALVDTLASGVESAVKLKEASRAIKMRSATDGNNRRTKRGCADTGGSATGDGFT